MLGMVILSLESILVSYFGNQLLLYTYVAPSRDMAFLNSVGVFETCKSTYLATPMISARMNVAA